MLTNLNARLFDLLYRVKGGDDEHTLALTVSDDSMITREIKEYWEVGRIVAIGSTLIKRYVRDRTNRKNYGPDAKWGAAQQRNGSSYTKFT